MDRSGEAIHWQRLPADSTDCFRAEAVEAGTIQCLQLDLQRARIICKFLLGPGASALASERHHAFPSRAKIAAQSAYKHYAVRNTGR